MATLNKTITNSHNLILIWDLITKSSFFNKIDVSLKYSVNNPITTLTLNLLSTLTTAEDTELDEIVSKANGSSFIKVEPSYDSQLNKGDVYNHFPFDKWGKKELGTSPTLPVILTPLGTNLELPIQDEAFEIICASNNDKGTLLSSGTITTKGSDTIEDSSATFTTDGVSIGDTVLLDDDNDHTVVIAIVSQTELTVKKLHHKTGGASVGANYRVVTPASTGAAVTHLKLANQEDGTEITEFVINNGTTAVSTANSYYRIPRMHAHGCGSNGTNVDDIEAKWSSGTKSASIISAGDGQTQMMHYHVPEGCRLEIDDWEGSIYNADSSINPSVIMELRSQLWGGDSENLERSMAVGRNGKTIHYAKPKIIPESTDVWVQITAVSDNGITAFSGITGTLIKN